MRPGMFSNDASTLRKAYQEVSCELGAPGLPETSLGSEHFFDDVVLQAVWSGQGLPYRRHEPAHERERHGGALLIEFSDLRPLQAIENLIFQLQQEGYIPVIAHPERYRAVWEAPGLMSHLLSRGAVALLDTAALVGKYGQHPESAARKLLEDRTYAAACSDAHRVSDLELVERGVEWIRNAYGEAEIDELFRTGPSALLEGQRAGRQ